MYLHTYLYAINFTCNQFSLYLNDLLSYSSIAVRIKVGLKLLTVNLASFYNLLLFNKCIYGKQNAIMVYKKNLFLFDLYNIYLYNLNVYKRGRDSGGRSGFHLNYISITQTNRLHFPSATASRQHRT